MTAPETFHRNMMKRALELARKGSGMTSPNPMVGAVLVSKGEVISEGYHHAPGLDHAEVEALKRAGSRAKGSILFVNLEPCSHRGRTPPCTEALIQAGVKEVYAAMSDPNPLVSGRGIKRLREAGVTVHVGLLSREAARLNESFCTFITQNRPFVIVKAAMSLDGKIATMTGDSGQGRGGISGREAHRYAHRLRRDLDAILVGAETVRSDNPRLTCRLAGPVRQPLRVVLDGLGTTDPAACVYAVTDAETLVFTTGKSPQPWRDELARKGVSLHLHPASDGRVPIWTILGELGKRSIASLLVEGGGRTIGAFVEAAAVDRMDLISSPFLFGKEGIPLADFPGVNRLEEAPRWRIDRVRRMGPDRLIVAYPLRRATKEQACSPG